MLFVQTGTLLGGLTPFNSLPVSPSLRTVYILSLAAPVLALVVWHLFPRRSWGALLMTGAMFAVPGTIVGLAQGSFSGWPVSVLTVSAPVFTLVGALGAATLIWQAGRPALGATLAGAAVVLQVVGPVVVISIGDFTSLRRFPTTTLLVVTVVLQILALAAGAVAVIATILRSGEPAARPRLRVTLAAGLAAFAPLLTFAIQENRGEEYTTISGFSLADLIGNRFLYLGLVFLAAGVIAGAIAGTHALVAAAAAGLMLGAFGVLFTPFIAAILNQPTLTVVAALGSLVVGVGVGLSRWRAQIGKIGLAVVTFGLVVLSFLLDGDRTYEGGAQVAVATLLVLGVIAGAAAFSAMGAANAATSETPAVLATLPTAFALGVIALTNHFMVHTSSVTPTVGPLVPAAGALLVATLLVALIAATGRAGAPEGR
jgi:hypothetical protein